METIRTLRTRAHRLACRTRLDQLTPTHTPQPGGLEALRPHILRLANEGADVLRHAPSLSLLVLLVALYALRRRRTAGREDEEAATGEEPGTLEGMAHDPYTGPPIGWLDGPTTITDDAIVQHLTSRGLDPVTEPYPCTLEVARHWDLPVAEAQQLVTLLH